MSVVRNLIIRAGADFSNMRREMRNAQTTLNKFSAGVRGTMAGIAGALAAIGIGTAIKDAVRTATEVEGAMQQINRTMGDSAQAFKDWANTTALSFNMGKSDAIKYGAVYSNLLSSFIGDTKTTMQLTEDLLKSSAVVAAATSRDMADVLDRIRSGLLGNTEAIEDLGINVNVAMIESTDAFKRFAGTSSWDQLSFQTQSQIRLFAILEQATKKYGSAVADNTASRQQQFVAQLKNVQLALGNAFLPIWNAVLPALTRMAAALATAMNVVSQFMQVLFGADTKATQAQTQATTAQAGAVGDLGDAYKEAGQKARGAVAGFDEVNQLADNDGSGGGSGGAAPAIPTMPGTDFTSGVTEATTKVSKKVQEMANRIKEAFRELTKITGADKARIKESVEGLQTAFGKFSGAFKDLGSSIKNNPHIQKWFEDFKSDKAQQVASLIDALAGGVTAWAGTLTMISGIISGDFDKTVKGMEQNLSGTFDAMTGIVGIFFPDFAEKMKEFKKNFAEKWASLKDDIKKYGDPTKLEVSDFGEWIKDTLGKKWDELKAVTAAKWDALKKTLSEKWEALKSLSWGDIKDAIIEQWEKMKSDTATRWEELKEVVSTKWEELKAFIHWDEIKETILATWDDLKTKTGEKWELFKTFLSGKWDAVKAFIKWDSIKDTILATWDELKTETGTKWVLLKETISEKWQAITNLDFSGVKTAVNKVWGELKTDTEAIWETIKNGIKDSVNWVIDAINKFINKVNSIEINIPSVDIPEWMGGGTVGGGTISMPQIPSIPRLARGGIVDGETNFGNYFAGEAGAEMIVPLENTSFVDKLASALGSAVMSAMQMSGSSSNQGNGDINIVIDGTKMARVLHPYLAKEDGRIGSAILRTT